MATATKLTAFLNLDGAKFESGLKKAKTNFKRFGKTLSTASKVGAVALAGITTALGVLGRKQSGVIDETAKLSAALGVNIKEFQALAHVASESGITQDQLGNSITKSQRSIVEASRGLKTYAQSFETLGLNVKDLLKLKPDEQFVKIATALSEIENPTLRTATALEIFGRSGRSVNNMLNNFKENLDSAREFNEKFNIELSAIDAAKVEEANDTFGRLGKVIGGLGNTIAIQFAPLITAMSEALLASGIDGETFGRMVSGGMETAAKGIDIVRVTLLGLKTILNEVMLAVDLFVLDASKSFHDLASALEILPGLQTAMVKAQETLANVNENARASAQKHIDALKELGEEAEKFQTTSQKIAEIQAEATRRAIENADATGKQSDAMGKLAEDAEEAAEKVGKVGKKSKETSEEMTGFEKATSDAFDGLLDDLSRGENALDSLKKTALNVLKDVLKSVISGQQAAGGGISGSLGGIFGGIFGGGGGGAGGGGILSSIFKSFPSFATGAQSVPRDTLAYVHKGETILTRQQTDSAYSGGGVSAGSITQHINVTTGVEQTVQAEIRRFMPEFKAIAVEAQKDAMTRGQI